MKAYIGLDIGGTKILGVLYNEAHEPIARVKKKTKAASGKEAVLDQVHKVVGGLLEKARDQHIEVDLQGIGAGCPGFIVEESTIVFTPNIPLKDFNLAEVMESTYGVPFVLGNDVNVAMYGEWKASDMQAAKNVLGLFVGTGVGGAIIIDSHLYTGQGGAAEIGHMVVNPEGAICGCGSQGCLEAYASKTGIQKAIQAQIRKGRKSLLKDLMEADGPVVKSSSLAKAYEAGDSLAVEVLDRAAYYLGIAVANLVNLFHPDLIILGGGMVESLGDALLPKITEEASRHTLTGLVEGVRFRLSHLSDDAGVYGAYRLILDHLSQDA